MGEALLLPSVSKETKKIKGSGLHGLSLSYDNLASSKKSKFHTLSTQKRGSLINELRLFFIPDNSW